MRSHEGGLAGSDSAKGGDWSGTLQEEEARPGQARTGSAGAFIPPNQSTEFPRRAALVEWTALLPSQELLDGSDCLVFSNICPAGLGGEDAGRVVIALVISFWRTK